MSRALVCLVDPRDRQEYYLEWSSIVDAPVGQFPTWGAVREKYSEAFLHTRFGKTWEMLSLEVALYGVTHRGPVDRDGARAFVAVNRAGPHEECLTVEEIIDYYCHGKEVYGVRHSDLPVPEAGP